MKHSRSPQDVRDDMRLCVITAAETTPEGKQGLRAQYMELEAELSDMEQTNMVLDYLFEPDNVIDKPARKVGDV